MGDAVIYAWREEQGDVWTGEWALDRKDKWVPAEANKYILATPEALAASPEVQKLVADAEARGMERAAEIVEAQGRWMKDRNLAGNGNDLIRQGKVIRAEAAIRRAEGEPT